MLERGWQNYDRLGTEPTRALLLDYTALIDDSFGDLIDPPVR
jgi:hypothetical protein